MKHLRAPFLVSVSLGAAAASGCGSSQGEMSVNPPPLPPASSCPEAAPGVGDACAEGLECHYGSQNICDADYQDFRCVNGAFDLLPRPSCNPPMPPPPEPSPTPVPSKA